MTTWFQRYLTKQAAPPITSDWLSDIHEFRKRVPARRQVIVYHGTSTKKLAAILSHGSLDPGISHEEEWRSYEGASPGIFVTTDPAGFMGAQMYAWHAARDDERGDGSDPVTLEIVVPFTWLDYDPDDTKYIATELGQEMNDLGKRQAVIRRPIPLSRIKQAIVYSSPLSRFSPRAQNLNDLEESTGWLPLGKLVDVIKKAARKEELPPEYLAMLPKRRGLAQQEAYEDREQGIGLQLLAIAQTMIGTGFGENLEQESILWVLEHPGIEWQNAWEEGGGGAMQQYLSHMGMSSDEFWEAVEGSHYEPRENEALYSYLRRAR